MTVFATLGPEGSNHELVTRRYLDFHGLAAARIVLVADFGEAVARFVDGEVRHIVQCAAHAEVAATIGAQRDRLFLMDTFMAPSRELAVLSRRTVSAPQSIGLHPATRPWLDLSPWQRVVDESSTAAVAAGLLEGRYDCGVTATAFADRHPQHLRVDRVIGSVVDAWLVYGPEPVCRGDILAWRGSPGAGALRRLAAADRAPGSA